MKNIQFIDSDIKWVSDKNGNAYYSVCKSYDALNYFLQPENGFEIVNVFGPGPNEYESGDHWIVTHSLKADREIKDAIKSKNLKK